MAEHLLRHLCAQRESAVETASCGTAAEYYYEVPSVVHRLLAGEGVPPFQHKPRLATREVLRWADVILVMTSAHYDHIVELYPEFASRTRLFKEAAGLGEQDVDDPMGRSDETFERCLAEIRKALEALLDSEFRAA